MLGGDKNTLKKSLLNISKAKKMYGKPFVGVGYILMKDNVEDIVNIKRLARQLGFDLIHYKELWITDPSLRKQSLRHNPELKAKVSYYLKVARETVDLPQDTFPFNLEGGDHYKKRREKKKRTIFDKPKLSKCNNINSDPNLACSSPWDTVKISVKGRVKICCHGETKIGNLKEEDFYDIWNSEEANKYRQGMLNKEYYKDCATCHCVTTDNKVFERNLKEKKIMGSGILESR